MKKSPLKRKTSLRAKKALKPKPCTESVKKTIRTQKQASGNATAVKKKNKKEKTPRQLCWDAFSLMIRLYYSDDFGRVKCYTCDKHGNWEGDGFMAGHLVPGRGNSVYVNREVVRVQCSICNMWNGGEQYVFGKNMEREVGEEKVKEFMLLKGKKVSYGAKDWNYMMLNFLYEAKNLAVEKGQNLPSWTRKYFE